MCGEGGGGVRWKVRTTWYFVTLNLQNKNPFLGFVKIGADKTTEIEEERIAELLKYLKSII